MAERAGFEPAVPHGITCFQDRLHKPLGHLSVLERAAQDKSVPAYRKIDSRMLEEYAARDAAYCLYHYIAPIT